MALERPPIADSVLDLVGGTPLVRLSRMVDGDCAEILGKMEPLNPAGSVKDRIALRMIEDAEEAGLLKDGATIVEATSGNTGIGLAMVAAVKGYRLLLTMPEDYSVERRKLLTRYGAECVLTPAIEGMSGAVFAAEELVRNNPDYFMPRQFDNPSNPAVHRDTTAREILAATGGELDAFVAAVGTGGTITPLPHHHNHPKPPKHQDAHDPTPSRVLAGKRPGLHAIQGIGASFVPSVLNRAVYDELIAVSDEDAIETSKQLTRLEGLLVGISSGANVWAARQVAKRLGPGRRVVTILCDTGERYLSVAM
jgi:cysteine synthase A